MLNNTGISKLLSVNCVLLLGASRHILTGIIIGLEIGIKVKLEMKTNQDEQSFDNCGRHLV